jgi:uncharacterized membrane-anchored protein
MKRSTWASALLFFSLVALLGVLARTAHADPSSPPPAPAGSEGVSINDLPWEDGPRAVDMGHGVTLSLPAGRRLLRGKEAVAVMEQAGNLYNEGLLGIVISSAPGSDYLVTIRYAEEGFIKDDDRIDPKDLLETIQKSEPEYNEERKKRGFPAIHAEGWLEDPKYDRTRHQLVWGLLVSTEGEKTVNFSTRVLGRRGFASVNLLTDPAKLGLYRDDGLSLVSATTFKSGDRYEDFDRSKDRVAEYGLAGLILGGVGVGLAAKAAKVGILAAFWKPILAFLLAAKKAVIALVVGAGALAKRLLGRRKKDAETKAT